jgi:hypothetical protein
MKPEEIKKLRELLGEPLNEEVGNVLAKQLADCEAWSARVSYAYRLALKELFRIRRNCLLPKSREHTELDRTTHLDADTSEFQFNADELKDLQEIMMRRISLGQSILKSLTVEVEGRL